MSRKVFDVLASTGGLILVVVLLVAGGLLTWGHSFVNSNVHIQLARQDITFPSKAAFAHPKAGSEITAVMIPSVSKYAGQQLLTGAQAEAYAITSSPSTSPSCPMAGSTQRSARPPSRPRRAGPSRALSRRPSRARHSADYSSRPTRSPRSV